MQPSRYSILRNVTKVVKAVHSMLRRTPFLQAKEAVQPSQFKLFSTLERNMERKRRLPQSFIVEAAEL